MAQFTLDAPYHLHFYEFLDCVVAAAREYIISDFAKWVLIDARQEDRRQKPNAEMPDCLLSADDETPLSASRIARLSAVRGVLLHHHSTYRIVL